MSAVRPVQTPIATPLYEPRPRQGGVSSTFPLVTPPLVTGHSPTLPALTPDQDRLFEALAKGHTSPAELAATLNLPVRQVLTLLATPEIAFHLEAIEAATEHLARHTTRLRHNLAFKSLETALTAAAAKENPGEIRRIATLLLKPTPPLPDPEAEQAERAERITKHRRAVKNDTRSEQKDAEYTALAAAMVSRVNDPIRATDRLSSTGRCSTPAPTGPQAARTSAQSSDTRPGGGSKPVPIPPHVPAQPAAAVASTAPIAFSPSSASPSHAAPMQALQDHPAQPRAA